MSFRGVAYPDVRIQYGYEKVPVEQVFEICADNRVTRAELRLQRVSDDLTNALTRANSKLKDQKTHKEKES